MQMQSVYGNRAARQALQTMPQSAPLQLKAAKINSWRGAHMRKFSKMQDPVTMQDNYVVEEDKMVGPKITGKDEVEDLGIMDATREWVMIKFSGIEGFVRRDKLEQAGMQTSRTRLKEAKANSSWGTGKSYEQEDSVDAFGENSGSALSWMKTSPEGIANSFEKQAEAAKSDNEKAKAERQGAGASTATGAVDAVSGIFGGLVALRRTVQSYRDANLSGMDKFKEVAGNALETADNGKTAFVGGATLVDSAAKASGHADGVGKSDAVSGWSGSVGEAIDSVKSTFNAVLHIVKLVDKALGKEGASKREVADSLMASASNLMQGAYSGVKTAKAILKIVDTSGAHKAASTALGTAIPAIGIAVSAIKITIKAYDIVKAELNNHQMRKLKKDTKFKENNVDKDYFKKRSIKLFGKTLHSSVATDTDKLRARRKELEGNTSRTEDEEKELKGIIEYEFYHELQQINRKRTKRAGLQIAFEMVSIAGDVATLSGAGAMVGAPLKAVASGLSVTTLIARKAKQYGRDRAAQAGAWWITKKMFDGEKSSEEKFKLRARHADTILKMIADLPEYDDSDPVQQQYKNVENVVRAAGCDPKALYRLNGDIEKQRELLIKALAERE